MLRVIVTYRGDQDALRRFNGLVESRVLPKAADQLARTTRRVALRHVPVLTGALRDSIAIADAGAFHRVVFADTPYARVVEFGFTGVQVVGPHQRLQTHAFGRSIAPRPVQVMAHTRFVNRAARPYMRPALAHAENRAVPILVLNLRRVA